MHYSSWWKVLQPVSLESYEVRGLKLAHLYDVCSQDEYFLLSSSEDYEFQTPGNHLFALNICRSPVRETFGLKDVDIDIGGFVRRDHGDFSIG